MKWNIPDVVKNTSLKLEKAGFETFLVGGCVRDLFLNKQPKDWDIATNALPEQIQSIFPESFYDNSFGTVSIKTEEKREDLKIIQVTPYRTEGEYADNRRPDRVKFEKDILRDLERRDFTVNAIAYSIKDNKIIDPHNGQGDMKLQIIRTVGNPDDRFQEDALRMLRAIRFSCETGFVVSQETIQAIFENQELLKKISKERIRDEFIKILMSERPGQGLTLFLKLNILDYVAPELKEGVGIEQNQAHAYDVWTHLLKTLECAVSKKWPLDIRLAALFHDIAKPRTRRKGTGKHNWTFYGHEVVGAKMTEKILTDLKFPKKTVEKVTLLVRWHMFFSDTEQITLSAVRRLISKVGKENIWDLMNVRVCDRIGTGRPKENPYRLRKYHAMVEEAMRDPISVTMLAIDGKDVIESTKMTAGPRIGWILHALLEEVIEDPKKNTPENLKKMAINMANLSDIELKKLGTEAKEKKEEVEEKELGEIRKKHFVK